MSNHQITHVEFSAQDLESTSIFYSNPFSWEFSKILDMNYVMFSTGGKVSSDFIPVIEDNPAGTLAIYTSTDEIDKTLANFES